MSRLVHILCLSLLAASCKPAASQQSVPVTKPKVTATTPEQNAGQGQQTNTQSSTSTADEANNLPGVNNTATTDPLSALSPDLLARLNPQQIDALRRLTAEQIRAMTPAQLEALLNANGGVPPPIGAGVSGSSGVGGSGDVLGSLLQQLPNLLGNLTGAGNNGQGNNGQGNQGNQGNQGDFGQDEGFIE